MNNGEALSYITRMSKTKVKPFEKWEGSEVKDWEFELELLDVGQNIDVSNAVANFPMATIPWIVKVEMLARCIIKINGDPFVTQEQLDVYNKEHNLEGENGISLLEYKRILIRKWPQFVVNKLEEEYNRLDREHQTRLLGGTLNPEGFKEEEKKKADKIIQKVTKEVEKTEEDKNKDAVKEEKKSTLHGSSLDVIASMKEDDGKESKQ